MVVGWLRVSLRLGGLTSLKEKRQVLRSVIARLGREAAFAVAEVGDQDLWGNAELGVSVVGNNPRQVESMLQHAEDLFGEETRWEVVGVDRGIETV